MPTFEWAIEDIISAFPSLALGHYVLKAVVMMKRMATSPCDFLVELDGFHLAPLEGESQLHMNVVWNPETAAAADRMGRTEQRAPIIEGAAIALAALLFARLLPESEMQVTSRGTRADYWLPKRHQVVEVSGTERISQIARRLRQKRRQVLANALGLGGDVVLCCFAGSQGSIKWTYHSHRSDPMARVKKGTKSKLLDDMLSKASWLVSHAMSLTDQGRIVEAREEWLRAADREEEAACLLEAEGHDMEAAVHHVSAASCYARVEQYAHAVPRLRSALSFALREAYRQEIEKLLEDWLLKAKKQLRSEARKKLATAL